MKRIFYLLAFAVFIQFVSCSTSGKTTQEEGPAGIKQKHFSIEQIEADALAMADVNCQWEIAKYDAALQENNWKLKEKEKSLYKLKFDLEEKIKIRYLQIEDLKKKFNKALERANKQLTACDRMNEIREMEKERAKMEEENQ
ncbi:MAG: hypothetical protein DRJ05_19000 [Bacteroidetes bacterium]|nr:MAG: hypothetical protein DRI89_09570 [Bacteroidota bacterium]RLD50928.1 MAG: hypothetical protein DRJ05_19000 [Bacteroidota bacterium]